MGDFNWYFLAAITFALLVLNLIERISYLCVFKDSRVLVIFNIVGIASAMIICGKVALMYFSR